MTSNTVSTDNEEHHIASLPKVGDEVDFNNYRCKVVRVEVLTVLEVKNMNYGRDDFEKGADNIYINTLGTSIHLLRDHDRVAAIWVKYLCSLNMDTLSEDKIF